MKMRLQTDCLQPREQYNQISMITGRIIGLRLVAL